MGWFDEQIRQRLKKDQDTLDDAFFRMAGAVMDRWDADRLVDQHLVARDAIAQILKYYRMKPVEIPDHLTDVRDQLAFALRPSGLMMRDVELEEDWFRDAWGPMLGFMKETGTLAALLPGAVHGYYFLDPVSGRKTRVTRKNAGLFSRDALCFYLPLPMKPLKIRDLLRYMVRTVSRGDLVHLALASLAAVLVGMLEPLIYNQVTGPILAARNFRLLIGIGVFLLSSAFASQLIRLIKTLLTERIAIKTSQAVEASVMMRILSLPVSFFRRFSSGELSDRATSVSALSQTLVDSILSVGLTSLLSLLYIAQIFHFAPALTLPSLAVALSVMLVSIAAALIQVGITRQKMKLQAEETGMTFALLTGIQKIRLSGAESRAFARWGRLYARRARLEYHPPAFVKLSGVLTLAISLAGTVALYYLALRSGVSAHDYYAFTSAFGQISAAFSALTGIAVSMASIRPILEMAEPLLEAEPEVSADRPPIPSVSGRIEMAHVSFRYDEDSPWVLQDLNLSIRPGEYVAIVGRTGCGKSTLVRLLLGFEKPEKGAIYYDRHDLNRVDPRSLRSLIGVVLQSGQLFQGDILSNILISAPHLGLEAAWEAAETAGIAQDIREMPMGMFTFIPEGQGGISGGQKQRLMIARAIAPKPKILILDEATSALDNRTQKQVSDALDRLRCTRVVIAHRLSTIRSCDRILVMDGGRILEEGTYDQLIEKNGLFAALVARQRLDTEEDPAEKNVPAAPQQPEPPKEE